MHVGYRDAAARHAPTQVNTTPELAAADIVLDMTSLLGRGGYGIVYSGTLHGDTLVAVKSLFTGGVPTPDLARSPSPSCQPARHCPPASFYLPCRCHRQRQASREGGRRHQTHYSVGSSAG